MNKFKITSKDWSPFTSDAAKYAFVLLRVSDYEQKELLGITRRLYGNIDPATSWKTTVENVLDAADDVPKDIVDAAKVVLYQLYGDMIRDVGVMPGQFPYQYGGVPMDGMDDD